MVVFLLDNSGTNCMVSSNLDGGQIPRTPVKVRTGLSSSRSHANTPLEFGYIQLKVFFSKQFSFVDFTRQRHATGMFVA